jgi:hypothetical protein
MHWSRRRQLRREQEQERLLLLLQVMVLDSLRRVLMQEFSPPMLEAMRRLDQRQLAGQMQALELASQQEDLLAEVLSSLQPSAKVQLLTRLG